MTQNVEDLRSKLQKMATDHLVKQRDEASHPLDNVQEVGPYDAVMILPIHALCFPLRVISHNHSTHYRYVVMYVWLCV